MPTRVLVVSLDGTTFDVLEPLARAGAMPTLAALLAEGSWGPLRSVVPPITPTAWSSFLTGKEPGKHGVFDFRLYDPQRYRDTFITSRALREPTLWELLTAAGRRTGVVGLPMMYPPDTASGTIVTGFDTPSTEVAFTHPPELRERILARFPAYRFVSAPPASDANVETDAGFAAFLGQVEETVDQRAAVALDLLQREPWDAFMVHFQDTDAMQHRVWRFIEQPERAPARWARIRGVYERIDRHLAALRAQVAPGGLMIVLSDHGFGSLRGHVNPNVLLQKWGYLDWKGRRFGRLRRSIEKRLVRVGLRRPAEKRGGPWVAEMRGRDFERVMPLVWSRTRAYVALGHMYGHLYVNLRGREPRGIVAPGVEYERLLGELRERLLAVRDPDDGAPVLEEIARGDELYRDDRLRRRPDLVLIPAPQYAVSRQLTWKRWLSRYGLVSGTHRLDGVFAMAGEGVRRGPVATPLRIVDVAPTILATLDVAIPDDVDGRVLDEVFTTPPASRFVAASAVARPTEELSADEEAVLADRLRALGYTE